MHNNKVVGRSLDVEGLSEDDVPYHVCLDLIKIYGIACIIVIQRERIQAYLPFIQHRSHGIACNLDVDVFN